MHNFLIPYFYYAEEKIGVIEIFIYNFSVIGIAAAFGLKRVYPMVVNDDIFVNRT